jgi:hypothetical protein
MGKLRRSEAGFSAVEVVLILVIVGLIGVVGFMVYKNHNKATPVATTQKTSTPKPVAVDPTTNWTAYSGSDGKISLKYPTTWVTASHSELCSRGILLLGADISSVGKCATEGSGQVSVTWQPSHADCGDLNSDAYTINSKDTVTVSGVSGLKQTATAKAPSFSVGADPEGTKVVNYCFNTDGYTYVADYTQLSSYPDALHDFNLMVTKTLKFKD